MLHIGMLNACMWSPLVELALDVICLVTYFYVFLTQIDLLNAFDVLRGITRINRAIQMDINPTLMKQRKLVIIHGTF